MTREIPLTLAVSALYRPVFFTQSRLLARAYVDLMPLEAKATLEVISGGVDKPAPRSEDFRRLRALRRTCQEWRNANRAMAKLREWLGVTYPHGSNALVELSHAQKRLDFLREALMEEVMGENRAFAFSGGAPSPET